MPVANGSRVPVWPIFVRRGNHCDTRSTAARDVMVSAEEIGRQAGAIRSQMRGISAAIRGN